MNHSTTESTREAGVSQPGSLTGRLDGPLVELTNVSVHYTLRGWTPWGRQKGELLRALDDVSLSVTKGVTLGLVGETGSGKTTVAKVVMGMTKPTFGTIAVAGTDLQKLKGQSLGAHRRLVQVVMQDPNSSLDPRMTVAEIVAEPLTRGYPLLGRRPKIRRRVAELLDLVGLSPTSARLYPHQFSGGQRQRIAIARALAPRPQLIVLDEPTSALDVSVRAQIVNLLLDLQSELGMTYLFISHDLATVAYMAKTVAVMYLGRIVEIGPVSSLYSSPLHPYTRLLLASLPTASRDFSRVDVATAGEAQTKTIPAGCRFHPRCSLRKLLNADEAARCEIEDPMLVGVGDGRASACHFVAKVSALLGTPTQH